MATTVEVPSDVRKILMRSTITADRLVLPPEQLDRKLYEKVNKVIVAAGGKWNRSAGAHLFKTDARVALGLAVESGKVEHRKNTLQAFYTPRALANRVAALVNPQPGERVLEPSCGEGALIWALLEREPNLLGAVAFDVDEKACDAVEANATEGHGAVDQPVAVECRNFLMASPESYGTFDAVVMNPPFAKDQDIDHVMHAWEFVKPGGRLVSIMSATWSQRGGGRLKKRRAFNAFVENLGGEVVPLGGDAFKESGACVHTVILRLDKPA